MEIIALMSKTVTSLRESGFKATARLIREYLHNAVGLKRGRAPSAVEAYMDVLFINGCDPEAAPHPPRYRVSHQKEQLLANNIVTADVYYTQLRLDQVRNYRMFIFFRCPYTETVGAFIKEARRLHKPVLFDIDDLVVDTKYTDTIPYVQSLDAEGKKLYDDGVIRMGKTLSLCDGAITTTERLAEELGHYVPEVFVNRNTASEEMHMLSEEVLKEKKRQRDENGPEDDGKVKIGYFSGSITHNADFEMILPAVVRVLKENRDAQLHVVGELDLPKELQAYKEQIVTREFVDWKKLPGLIGSVDINLAPIEETIFNEAKSENKWVEAALVKVPTVASDFGAFRRMIRHGETGLLCRTTEDWYRALTELVRNGENRRRIAENAYEYCRKHCVTLYTGRPLAEYIRGKMNENAALLLPSTNISGGIMVGLRHACYLYDAGLDVVVFSDESGPEYIEFEGHRFPLIQRNRAPVFAHFDKAIATMWTTSTFLETYPHIRQRYYLVQNFETDFYEPGVFLRFQANQSYCLSRTMQFLTVSKWCEKWLLEDYGRQARYIPNGIDFAHFRARRRTMQGKVRVLIEGDSASYYKNVDESFAVADRLDPERYEIWYMSYNAGPKDTYRVDRFLHCVPYEKVFEVYAQCDILLKSSFLESFSYPPLEMMASGGYAVVVPNDGNAEYLRDGENCLLYPKGDIDKAVECIEKLCADKKLQESLYRGGLETAKSRDWQSLRGTILAAYDVQEKDTER